MELGKLPSKQSTDVDIPLEQLFDLIDHSEDPVYQNALDWKNKEIRALDEIYDSYYRVQWYKALQDLLKMDFAVAANSNVQNPEILRWFAEIYDDKLDEASILQFKNSSDSDESVKRLSGITESSLETTKKLNELLKKKDKRDTEKLALKRGQHKEIEELKRTYSAKDDAAQEVFDKTYVNFSKGEFRKEPLGCGGTIKLIAFGIIFAEIGYAIGSLLLNAIGIGELTEVGIMIPVVLQIIGFCVPFIYRARKNSMNMKEAEQRNRQYDIDLENLKKEKERNARELESEIKALEEKSDKGIEEKLNASFGDLDKQIEELELRLKSFDDEIDDILIYWVERNKSFERLIPTLSPIFEKTRSEFWDYDNKAQSDINKKIESRIDYYETPIRLYELLVDYRIKKMEIDSPYSMGGYPKYALKDLPYVIREFKKGKRSWTVIVNELYPEGYKTSASSQPKELDPSKSASTTKTRKITDSQKTSSSSSSVSKNSSTPSISSSRSASSDARPLNGVNRPSNGSTSIGKSRPVKRAETSNPSRSKRSSHPTITRKGRFTE